MCHTNKPLRTTLNINLEDVLLNGAAAIPIEEAETELGFKLTVEIIAPTSTHEPLEVNILWRLIDGWLSTHAKPNTTPPNWGHTTYVATVIDDDQNVYNISVAIKSNHIEVTITPTEVILKC